MTTKVDKAQRVNAMFARIARRYDLMNTVMTLGLDRRWRRLAVAWAEPSAEAPSLDVATGTGEMLLELSDTATRAVGIDSCAEMLARARSKLREQKPGCQAELVCADALELPFQDDTFGCVVTAFSTRNFADLRHALAEMRRVLRPGGRFVSLELVPPGNAPASAAFHLYVCGVVPLLGQLIAGDGEAYRYLPDSAAHFHHPEELAALMREAGLREVGYRLLNLGMISIHRGVK